MNSVFGLLVKDCQSLLFSMNHVVLRFVKRSANRAAHFVARGSRFLHDHMDECSIPAELHAILYSDSSI